MPDTLSSGRTSPAVIPDVWTVYVLRETRDTNGKKIVLLWDTTVVGSFSDCSRDKRRIILPTGKGYRSVMARQNTPIVVDWGDAVYQGAWVNPTT